MILAPPVNGVIAMMGTNEGLSMRTRQVQFLKFWENVKQSLEVLQSISLYPDERFS